MDLVTRDYASPEADIGPTLTLCGLPFRLEVWNGGSRRNGIEGHVNDDGNPSRSGCLGSCCETFPIGAPRLVEVDMGTVRCGAIRTGNGQYMRTHSTSPGRIYKSP